MRSAFIIIRPNLYRLLYTGPRDYFPYHYVPLSTSFATLRKKEREREREKERRRRTRVDLSLGLVWGTLTRLKCPPLFLSRSCSPTPSKSGTRGRTAAACLPSLSLFLSLSCSPRHYTTASACKDKRGERERMCGVDGFQRERERERMVERALWGEFLFFRRGRRGPGIRTLPCRL